MYKVPRQPPCLSAEENEVSVFIFYFSIEAASLCRRQPHPLLTVFFYEIVKAFVYLQVDVRPVIKPGSLHMSVVYIESQRFDKMELGVCGRACSGYIARIGRYFRFYEYYVKTHTKSSSPDNNNKFSKKVKTKFQNCYIILLK